MINTIMSGLLNTLFGDTLKDMLNIFQDAFIGLSSTVINVLEFDIVQNGIAYMKTLALTLLVIKVIFEIFNTYILYQSGNPDAEPTNLVMRTIQSVAIIMSTDWIVKQIFIFSGKVANDVGNLDIGTMSYVEKILGGSFASTMLAPLFGLVFVIMLLILVCQVAIRAAHIALLCFISPIMAISISSTNRGMWNSLIKELVVLSAGHIFQLFTLSAMVACVSVESVGSSGLSLLFLLGFMISAIKAPKFISQFVYSTGGGQVAGSAVRGGSQVVSIIRTVASK